LLQGAFEVGTYGGGKNQPILKKQMRLVVRFRAPTIPQSIELVNQGNLLGNGNAISLVAFFFFFSVVSVP
jgi:hypothetical protein